MTVSVTTFRQSYPEFTPIAYPASAVEYYLVVAGLLLSPARLGVGATVAASPPTTIYDLATELFVAHNLTIEKRAQDAAATGAVPGEVGGPVSSKSVGPMSVSYANAEVALPDAGHWNLSTYGLRFIQLIRPFGAGPVQIGIGVAPPFSGGGAWAGPPVLPGWPGWG